MNIIAAALKLGLLVDDGLPSTPGKTLVDVRPKLVCAIFAAAEPDAHILSL